MVSTGNKKQTDEIQEELGRTVSANGSETKGEISFHIQTSQKGLLDEKKKNNMFLDILNVFPNKANYMKFDPSPSAKFRRFAEGRDEVSRNVPSAEQRSTSHFHVPFVNKINWASLRELSKQWIRNPMNMALFVWILCVTVSGAILFLVMTGMLNGAIQKKSQRDTWFEVNNQILNALFTLMCLYQHPKRLYHLVLLCRWRADDVLKLRKAYCKNGTYKPNEWVHMMVVIILLNLNCFAQYALCGLNLGYSRSERPPIGVGLCISVSIGAPAFASVYNILSPLGKEYETETDQEAQNMGTVSDVKKPGNMRSKSLEKRYSFIVRDNQRVEESRPEWVGGLFDIWDDISLAYLSFFCSCCVFGWNMERLGFGNMYVHIATFLLFCLAPFFIFNLAAVNIDNEPVREALGIAGILLCVFGLLYGGFWRIQMRKRFNLPGNTFCCGKPAVTDCFQWLCCCSCSLAQEVRTADYYDVAEDKFYAKRMSSSEQLQLSTLPGEDGLPLFRSSPRSPYHEDGMALFKSSPSSPYMGRSGPSHVRLEGSSTPRRSPGGRSPDVHLAVVSEESFMNGEDSTMKPPVPSIIP
ncbi:uncharacterized protein M6B38_350340 [Iris pallida]|uniref:PLAC8 motif-containing protein n=1 Tax=Iris pallida TaxID=29817 RepID=A0AAX6GQQ7_IRIPA|nr:uncharacterized protein M6B38_350340 [Iris pallida]